MLIVVTLIPSFAFFIDVLRIILLSVIWLSVVAPNLWPCQVFPNLFKTLSAGLCPTKA